MKNDTALLWQPGLSDLYGGKRTRRKVTKAMRLRKTRRTPRAAAPSSGNVENKR